MKPYGTVRWFGESWGAPVCEQANHIETPVGMPCGGHEHLHSTPDSWLIHEHDQGITVPYHGAEGISTIAYHLDCWLHEIGADRVGVHRD